MSRQTLRRLFAMLAALALVFAACSDGDATEDTTDDTSEGTTAETTVAPEDAPSFIYITPGAIGVNKFLELGKIGSENAAAEHGGTAKTFESTDLSSRRANVEAAIDESPTVIVLTTFEFTEMSKEFADANPDQDFILIDACPEDPPSNLYCGVFREYEASYLLGVMAGQLTEVGKIGSVAALDIPFLHRYTDGFALGAQSRDATISDSQVFIGGDNPFLDPARAKEQALALAAQGADHIFAVGAGSNGGIFEAAEEAGFLTYGVDVNQCPDAPGHIVDNTLKRVDVVVELLIDRILKGDAESFNSFGLAEGGMGVVALEDDLASSECVIAEYPEIVAEVRTVADSIIDGSLVLDDPMMALLGG